MDGRYKKGEALRMVNTRRRSVKDACNEKTRRILSQQEKQSVTVRQARYFELFILANEVLRITIFYVEIRRRG